MSQSALSLVIGLKDFLLWGNKKTVQKLRVLYKLIFRVYWEWQLLPFGHNGWITV